jgi:PAS domain S-box-containing protein
MEDPEEMIERLRKELDESRKQIDELKKSEVRCRKAEDALRESEQKLGLFIENAPAAIAMLDREMRYLAVSRRWLHDYGLGDQDIIGRCHYEIFPEIPQRWKEIHRRGLDGQADRCEEDPFPRRDGSVDWVRWEVLPWYGADGEVGGIIILTEVITERKKLEQELLSYRDHLEALVKQRTAELEQRNRELAREVSERMKAQEERSRMASRLVQAQRIEALDRFAGGIAHDLNNILYPIIINTEELLAEEPPGSPRREILDQILKAANRQKNLVKKILSFSRHGEMNLAPVRVALLLRETMGFLRSSLPSTIEIMHRIEAGDDVVMADAIQLQQVIMNIVQNAADALSEHKGTIEVALKRVRLESAVFPDEIEAGDFLELTIRDSGSGIPPEVLERIFEPFYTTKDVGKGTGLGLSVAHGIVKCLGGTITVESAAGTGTLFTVYLPVYAGKEEV